MVVTAAATATAFVLTVGRFYDSEGEDLSPGIAATVGLVVLAVLVGVWAKRDGNTLTTHPGVCVAIRGF